MKRPRATSRPEARVTSAPADVTDPLRLLERPDKHFLAAGDGCLFAPRFPVWLERPGFWDEAQVLLFPVAPLFTVAFVDAGGRELALDFVERKWNPAALVARYRLEGAGEATEARTVLPGGCFVSQWTVACRDGAGAGQVSAVAWTTQPARGAQLGAGAPRYGDGAVHLRRRVRDAHGRGEAVLALQLAAAGGARSWAAYAAQGPVPPPDFAVTPFAERWRGGRLADEAVLGTVADAGTASAPPELVVFAAIERPLEPQEHGIAHLVFACTVAPADPDLRPMADDAARALQLHLARWFAGRLAAGDGEPRPQGPGEAALHDPEASLAGEEAGAEGPAGRDARPASHAERPAQQRPSSEVRHVAVPLRVAPPADNARPGGEAVGTSPAALSRASWSSYFAGVPVLRCSDPYLERYFPYRWYGLRLNFVEPAGRIRHPTVCEGIGFFHLPILFSAPAHVRELRWLHDPRRARGVLLAVLDAQRADGSLPGFLYAHDAEGPEFYHADLGGALLALEAVHPDRAFVEAAYGPLARYAEWARRTRDPEGSGLYTVTDPYETGQEFSPRYLAVDPRADRYHFDGRLRLKGVDATVYQYRLRRVLARAAAALGRAGEAAAHDRIADAIAEAVRASMWDPSAQLFSHVDPHGLRRTGVKAAVCFYPYFTDIAGSEHLAGLRAHLLNPAEFWTPFPVPSASVDDPTFSAAGEWRGVRRACPWNGRTWPMAHSHVVEALARASELDPGLEPLAAELLSRFVRMLCFDGDPARPNAFEHYNPFTGHPSVYRGIDDYQHSWVNDLIIRFVAGLRVRDDGSLDFHPLPMGVERLDLERVRYRGRELSVRIEGAAAVLKADGAVVAQTVVGAPVRVSL